MWKAGPSESHRSERDIELLLILRLRPPENDRSPQKSIIAAAAVKLSANSHQNWVYLFLKVDFSTSLKTLLWPATLSVSVLWDVSVLYRFLIPCRRRHRSADFVSRCVITSHWRSRSLVDVLRPHFYTSIFVVSISGSESPKGVSGRIFGPKVSWIFGQKCFGKNSEFWWWKEYSLIAEYSVILRNIRWFYQIFGKITKNMDWHWQSNMCQWVNNYVNLPNVR